MALTTNVQLSPPSWPWSWRELTLVVFGFAALTVFLTWPLAAHLGTLGRADNGDGRISIWNVAWVARTLVIDPLHVFDANIFYPPPRTLAYSESNLGAGILAIPVYWTTGNPYAAHNFVFLLSFVLSAIGMYYLVRYLAGDRRAAAVAATCFAFCPYVFAHTPHIQLLMTAGLPFSMLAFHRLVDRPTPAPGRRARARRWPAQALCCGYYAVFVMLMVGFAVLVVAVGRPLADAGSGRRSLVGGGGRHRWSCCRCLCRISRLQRATGFDRAARGRAAVVGRLAACISPPRHRRTLRLLRAQRPLRTKCCFPAWWRVGFGVAGLAVGWAGSRALARGGDPLRRPGRAGVLGVVRPCCWSVRRAVCRSVPVFSLLHAPSRFGLVVSFALSVLAGLSISALLRSAIARWLTTVVAAGRGRRRAARAAAVSARPAVDTRLPGPGGAAARAVIEMPVFSRRVRVRQNPDTC